MQGNRLDLGWRARCDHLPLSFGGKARSRPASKGVCLVVRDVRYGFVRSQWLSAIQGEDVPTVSTSGPIQRRLAALDLVHGPTVREPKAGATVSVVFHERQPLSGSNQAVGDRE